ncbi:hypothetical protein AKJ09_10653 [Labilithrix luteola]|uniref:DUF262 domain-containing protein n=1 Tax=Labilithrix luteola TaxID=1391654 RepID=A0A0K1QEX7_9BACT|nr:DUF262 domain-containing protein [Labilithrix luteola]AKV03990.1 hypothetical protein AKJ09_10653 [Labilithrix luteola]
MASPSVPRTSLSIKGETVQRIYGNYVQGQYIVNRRYQRKLVWSIEEKRAFIDSLRQGFPVPLILLGEASFDSSPCFEIIDGLQRLNALTSFIEGEFDLDGRYFDLKSIPETNVPLAQGHMHQKTPILSQQECARIVSYEIANSIYRFQSEADIDEVFRRINSNGRHLSRQELRQAGATGVFAQQVRHLATHIRGDVSARDRLRLSAMKEISITNKDLPYGINVENLFWVKHKILTREYVRDSRDEELIADIISFMIMDDKPSSNSDVLDSFFGVDTGDDGAAKDRFGEIESAAKKRGEAAIRREFLAVHDAIRSALESANRTFNELILSGSAARAPRYYQAVFLAFNKLINEDGMKISKPKKLIEALDGLRNSINISEGGSWSAVQRQDTVNTIAGRIQPAFSRRRASDPATESWVTEFENILQASKTENALYDFKIGVHDLTPEKSFNANAMASIGCTIAAIANQGPHSRGYVLIGVADSPASAKRHGDIYGSSPIDCKGFHVTGVDDESSAKFPSLDRYIQFFTQQLSNQPLPKGILNQVSQKLRAISYFDKTVIVIEIGATSEPVAYDKEIWIRRGPHNHKLSAAEVVDLTLQFMRSE